MKRNAISRWELSDHFWAESDPPEPCGTRPVKGFLRKCARRLDRMAADKRVKYRLVGRGAGAPADETARGGGERSRSIGREIGRGCRASARDGDENDASVADRGNGRDDGDLGERQPCVIKRTDESAGSVFPYREVSSSAVSSVNYRCTPRIANTALSVSNIYIYIYLCLFILLLLLVFRSCSYRGIVNVTRIARNGFYFFFFFCFFFFVFYSVVLFAM